jgi:hypothetical protein
MRSSAGFILCGAGSLSIRMYECGKRPRSTSANARECVRQAEQAPTQERRGKLIELARVWMAAASQRGGRQAQVTFTWWLVPLSSREPGVVLRASWPSIAARIHSRAMSNSFSRSSGLGAWFANLTQSRANSSNSDADDMVRLRQGSIRRVE